MLHPFLCLPISSCACRNPQRLPQSLHRANRFTCTVQIVAGHRHDSHTWLGCFHIFGMSSLSIPKELNLTHRQVQIICAFLEKQRDVPSELSYLLSAIIHSGHTGIQLTVLPPVHASTSRSPPRPLAQWDSDTPPPTAIPQCHCPRASTAYRHQNHPSGSWRVRADPRIRGSPSAEAIIAELATAHIQLPDRNPMQWAENLASALEQNQNLNDDSLENLVGRCVAASKKDVALNFLLMLDYIQLAAKCQRYVLLS